MRYSNSAMLVVMVLVAGLAAAEQPFDNYTQVPAGTEPAEWNGGPSTTAAPTRALTFWNNRAAFDAAFPGLPTEDWSGTIVAAGAILSCNPPLNSSTNDACFPTGGVLPGIEMQINNIGGGQYVVIGTGALGNAEVWVGPNTFIDDVIFNFNPAVRAAGLDVVNPMTPGQVYTVEIFGPGGSLGTTNVTDGGIGNFWGVDSTDVGGITSIVFNGAGDGSHSELTAYVTFGGTPVPVELQSFDVE